jgi:hypothetical protein
LSRLERLSSLLHAYLRSAYHGMLHGKLFDQVQSYCMFVGHPRSGHTLIGALLDAHPHIVIAHELNALRYVRLVDRFQLQSAGCVAGPLRKAPGNRR